MDAHQNPRYFALSCEMFWKHDPDIEATRKLPGWASFHKDAGRAMLAFDKIERVSRNGAYIATAYTWEPARIGFRYIHLAEGRGATALDSVIDAYRLSGIGFDTADHWISVMRAGHQRPAAPPPQMVDDFDDEPVPQQPEPEDDFGELVAGAAATDDFGDL